MKKVTSASTDGVATSAKKDDSLVAGKRKKNAGCWKPGQSGNPSGKKKQTEEEKKKKEELEKKQNDIIRDIANFLPTALAEGMRLMTDPDVAPSVKARLLEMFIDRVYGKPYQSVQIEDNSTHRVELDWGEGKAYGA